MRPNARSEGPSAEDFEAFHKGETTVNMKTILKTSVATAALMAIGVPAMAQDTFMGIDRMNQKVKLSIYGQVNKAVLWGDDGNTSRTFIVDNDVSSTRIGFLAMAPVSADFSFGAQFEVEMGSNSSSSNAAPQGTGANAGTGVQINTGAAGGGTAGDSNVGDINFVERLAEVTMDHKRFGKISLGNGSTATDGITEFYQGGAVNVIGVLSAGTALASTILYDDTNKRYYRPTFKSAAAAAASGSGVSYFDGARDDRVRYDTPRFMGFRATGSFASGGEGAGAIDYNQKLGQFRIIAGVGYSNFAGRSATQQEVVAGSFSVLHDSGLNMAIAAGHRVYKQNWQSSTFAQVSPGGGSTEHHDLGNSTTVGGSVGYIAKIFGAGPTAFGVDYHHYNNVRVQGSDTDSIGIGVEQTFAGIGTSAYLGYRNNDHSVGDREKNTYGVGGAMEFSDVNIVIAGVRVQF